MLTIAGIVGLLLVATVCMLGQLVREVRDLVKFLRGKE